MRQLFINERGVIVDVKVDVEKCCSKEYFGSKNYVCIIWSFMFCNVVF